MINCSVFIPDTANIGVGVVVVPTDVATAEAHDPVAATTVDRTTPVVTAHKRGEAAHSL